jgi:uncharacterized pyridoxal phosphate-containing UPF0001 family protein
MASENGKSFYTIAKAGKLYYLSTSQIMNDIVSNIHSIRNRILNACKNVNRNPQEVKLLLATKTVSAQNIAIALHAGETLIGENKIQELKDKFEALKNIPHQSHFIGHLQSNKIKEVIKYADCIQSVDRLSLAEKLQKDWNTKTNQLIFFCNSIHQMRKANLVCNRNMRLHLPNK